MKFNRKARTIEFEGFEIEPCCDQMNTILSSKEKENSIVMVNGSVYPVIAFADRRAYELNYCPFCGEKILHIEED